MKPVNCWKKLLLQYSTETVWSCLEFSQILWMSPFSERYCPFVRYVVGEAEEGGDKPTAVFLPSGLLFSAYALCMYGLYSCMPVVVKRSSATSVNLSLLTADLFSLFCGIFLFQYSVSRNTHMHTFYNLFYVEIRKPYLVSHTET